METHNLYLNIKEDKFIPSYLQIMNGILKLNKPEFKVLEYIIKNNIIINKKEIYDKISDDLEWLKSNTKMQIRNLLSRKVLVETKDGIIVNPVFYSGKKSVCINFNILENHE